MNGVQWTLAWFGSPEEILGNHKLVGHRAAKQQQRRPQHKWTNDIYIYMNRNQRIYFGLRYFWWCLFDVRRRGHTTTTSKRNTRNIRGHQQSMEYLRMCLCMRSLIWAHRCVNVLGVEIRLSSLLRKFCRFNFGVFEIEFLFLSVISLSFFPSGAHSSQTQIVLFFGDRIFSLGRSRIDDIRFVRLWFYVLFAFRFGDVETRCPCVWVSERHGIDSG